MNEIPFRCPICGGTKYELKSKGPVRLRARGSDDIDHYVCKGCSVMFHDPRAFSHALDEK